MFSKDDRALHALVYCSVNLSGLFIGFQTYVKESLHVPERLEKTKKA